MTVAARARLLSCDVFDTALVRRVGSPSAVFIILGRRMALKDPARSSPEGFAHARMEANRRARANAGRGMALKDIYLELQFALGLTDEEREAIMREELALEAELLAPVPGAAERLQMARASGMTVAFLSDMYLGSAFLEEQLGRHGMIESGERCQVSCEAGCGKEDGRGFRLMATREGVELGKIVHRGNDPRADIAAAKAIGIRTEPFLQGNLHRYEEVLEAHSFATGGLSSAIAGASRLARLTIPAEGPREAAIRDVAASVAAPILIGYALWVLFRARDQRLRHLDFARPILLRVADQLNRRLGLDIEFSSLPSAEAASWDRILGADGGSEPAVFAFSRSSDPARAEAGSVHAFFADHVRQLGHRRRADEMLHALFFEGEAESATGSGGNGPDPVEMPMEIPVAMPLAMPLASRTITAVAEHLWLDPEALDLEADLRPAIADVVETFLRSPSPAEADAWGRDHAGSWPEARLALASPLSRGLVTTAVRLRSGFGRVARSALQLRKRG
jgi:FMN phosphatase YigB (HAD superfamily)